MVVVACGSFSSRKPPALVDPVSSLNISSSTAMSPTMAKNISDRHIVEEEESILANNDHNLTSKNLCAICLETLSYGSGNSPGQAIFTAQCSHAFHFACISSNVRHGSVTCPICRAHWTQLPRNLHPPCSHFCNQADPIFQILDDSIASFRVHRRSFLRSARYDDDDPTEPDHIPNQARLEFSLLHVPPTPHPHPCTQPSSRSSLYHQHHHSYLTGSSSFFLPSPSPYTSPLNRRVAAYLSVKLAHQEATDLVLVASPNGPHLRLLKQSLALVVFSLRPIDRLAIVTYSSVAARVFPLRRMTTCGKRNALQVIDRLFYMGQADPIEGLKKGIKILDDRAHKNPASCILHLSDSPTRSYHALNIQVPIPIHRFHVGFGFGTSHGFVIREFEDFLARLLKGMIRDVKLKIGGESTIVTLEELRGNEERRIVLDLSECQHVNVAYSYVEGGVDEFTRTGEAVVSLADKREALDTGREHAASEREGSTVGGRTSSVENWDYHDPYMARRWAKHLHGYRLQ